VDEADFMFDIGFQVTIDFILKSIKKQCNKFQMLCFTATLTNGVVDIVK
jgi:superfamily II DNA/RNA helicase